MTYPDRTLRLPLVRGDNPPAEIVVTENGEPVNLSLGYVLRLTARQFVDDEETLFSATSYPDGGIDVFDEEGDPAPEGTALWFPEQADTETLVPSEIRFDIEITRRAGLVTDIGTAAVITGSRVVAFSGADLTGVKRGHMLFVDGAEGETQGYRLITAVNVLAGTVTVDYDGWEDESGIDFAIYKTFRLTPILGFFDVYGDLTLDD